MRPSSSLVLLLLSSLAASAQNPDPGSEIPPLNREVRGAIAGRVPVNGTLARRASLVRSAIRTNPREARALLLAPEEIASAREIRGMRADLLERPASYLSGDEVEVVDASDFRSSYFKYRLRTPDGDVWAYQDSAAGEAPRCGRTLRLDGYQLADTMLVTRAVSARDTITPDPACPVVGEQRAAVLLVSFPSRPISTMTPDQYRDTFFSAGGPSVNHFYQESSYGQTSVSGDVFGPFVTSKDYNSCDDSTAVINEAFQAADAAVDLSQYQRVFVVTPRPTTCGFGGFGSVGCFTYASPTRGNIRLSRVYQFDASSTEILRVSPHELGHNLGLLHSRSDLEYGEPLGPDRSKFSYTEYGDVYSGMGGQGPYHFSAPHKLMLNWLTDGTGVRTVSDGQVVELLPMSSPDPGLKGVRVRRNLNTDEYLWVEYRTPTGYDKALGTRLGGGALIHYEDATTGGYAELLNFGSSFNDAELGVGQVWRDPYSDVTLEVLSSTPDRLRVAIRYEKPCATVTWPVVNRYSASAFNVFADVSAEPACRWAEKGNNAWLTPTPPATTAGNGTAAFVGLENAGVGTRRGSVTVERQTLFLDQDAVKQPLSLRYFSPKQGVGAQGTYFYFMLGVDAPNGAATLGTLDLLLNGSASYPGACALTYDFASQTATLLDDAGNTTSQTLVAGKGGLVRNAACSVGALSDSRPETGFSQIYVAIAPLTKFDSDRKMYYRLRHAADAVPGDWMEGGTLTAPATGECGLSVTPPLVQLSSAALSFSVTVSGASTCAWQASTDADWLTLPSTSGTGPGRVTVTAAANPSDSQREATILFNRFAVQVRQLPKGFGSTPYLRFSQDEIGIGRAGGSATLQFQSNFPDGGVEWRTDVPWLRITGYRMSIAGCPCLDYTWDSNVTPDQRRGSIMGPLGANLYVVQDSGALRAGDYNLKTAAGRDGAPEGGAPLETVIKRPDALVIDSAGNVIFAEEAAGRLRKVTPDGRVLTLAGLGYNTTAGQTGPALQVGLSYPQGLAVDASDNIYFTDYSYRVRKLSPDGMVTVVAGTGGSGFTGDGGPATNATFRLPVGLAVATDGTIFVSDSGNNRIRKIAPDGKISTIVGTGTAGSSGDQGPGDKAQLSDPRGLALAADGSLLIADAGNQRVRRLSPDGIVTTVAGNGSAGSNGDGGLAINARLYRPYGLSVDAAGNIYIAEQNNFRIRKVSPDGNIATAVGGTYGADGDGGAPAQAMLSSVRAVAALPNGDLYIADTDNHRIRFVQAGVQISAFAGVGTLAPLGDGGVASSATFFSPGGLAADTAGNIYVADTENHRVRKIAADGTVSTIAGTGRNQTGGTGSAIATPLSRPAALAFDSKGAMYVTSACQVRRVGIDGVISTFAGTGSCGFTDGPAAQARFSTLTGLAFDAAGNLFVADTGNHRIRKITTDGQVITVAGTGSSGSAGDGGPAVRAQLYTPMDVAVDATGNLYVADINNYRIRKISADGNISTVVGGSYGYGGDGGMAVRAQIGFPAAVRVDGAGNLYIADAGFNVVRKVGADGRISTIAGTGTAGFSGDEGPAWGIRISGPTGLALTADGVLVSDTYNDRIRKLTPAGTQ